MSLIQQLVVLFHFMDPLSKVVLRFKLPGAKNLKSVVAAGVPDDCNLGKYSVLPNII